MLTVKVRDGTPPNRASLCHSCKWAHVIKGYRANEELVQCGALYPRMRVPFSVRECTEYYDRNHPTKKEMEQIAWILVTKRIERHLGFVKAGEYRRVHGEGADITP
jgi:hypothetical protein